MSLRIFRRRSEWDFSWVKHLRTPAEIILCSIYEHSRYALLCRDQHFRFPPVPAWSALPHLLAAAETIGPICFFGFNPFVKLDLPISPYRSARKQVAFDPEFLLRQLEQFSDPRLPIAQKLEISLPANGMGGSRENILAQAFEQLTGTPAQPKRGAGARIRKAKTALKYLGALKLLDLMTAPEALRHTEKELAKPLLATEVQWSRARKRAGQNLAPYHAEATVLLEALSEKRAFSHFSLFSGKLEVDWKAEK